VAFSEIVWLFSSKIFSKLKRLCKLSTTLKKKKYKELRKNSVGMETGKK